MKRFDYEVGNESGEIFSGSIYAFSCNEAKEELNLKVDNIKYWYQFIEIGAKRGCGC